MPRTGLVIHRHLKSWPCITGVATPGHYPNIQSTSELNPLAVSLCFFLSVLCTTQSKLKTCYVACAGFLSVSLCFSLSVLCATQSKLKTCYVACAGFCLFLSVCALYYTVETKNLFCCLRRFLSVSLCFSLSVLCPTQSKLKTCSVACAGFRLFSLCFFLSVLCTTQSKLKTCYCCLRRFLSVSLCFSLSVLCATQSKLKTCSVACAGFRLFLSVSFCLCSVLHSRN